MMHVDGSDPRWQQTRSSQRCLIAAASANRQAIKADILHNNYYYEQDNNCYYQTSDRVA